MSQTFSIICILAVAVLIGAEWHRWMAVRMVSKSIAAVSFVLVALSLGALGKGVGGYALCVGLGLSLVGDICLLSSQSRIFKIGIFAFLLAHLAYMGLFVVLGVDWIWVGLGGLSVGLLALGIGRFLRPFVQQMRSAVYAYIIVISVMVAMAIGMGAASNTSARVGLLISALAFFLSDLCVARERFVYASLVNKAVGLPLYFGAQLGFAWYGLAALTP